MLTLGSRYVGVVGGPGFCWVIGAVGGSRKMEVVMVVQRLIFSPLASAVNPESIGK